MARAVLALCAWLLAACDTADAPESTQPRSSSVGQAGRDAQRALRDSEYRGQIESQTHAIESGTLSGESLASAFHDRAAAYMNLGEWAAALRDLDELARLRPTDPHAWVDRAHAHLYQADEAAADADLAQARARGTLGPRDAVAAGVVEYVRGRPKDALNTFRGALADEEGVDGMYARLWIAALASEFGNDVDALLGRGLAEGLPDRWPAPIVRFMAGELTERELLRHVGRRVSQANLERKCEVWFYIGQQRRLEGRLEEARAAYQNALDTGVREYFEHLAARVELERLGEALANPSGAASARSNPTIDAIPRYKSSPGVQPGSGLRLVWRRFRRTFIRALHNLSSDKPYLKQLRVVIGTYGTPH